LIFLIIAFRKKFKNVIIFTFLECFGQEHKFAICFNFFLRYNFQSTFDGILFK
jgi:hypothetical protein